MGKNFFNRTCTEHKIAGMIRRYDTRGEEWAEARERKKHEKLIEELKKDPVKYKMYLEAEKRVQEVESKRKADKKNIFLAVLSTFILVSGLSCLDKEISTNTLGLVALGCAGYIGVWLRVKFDIRK